MSKSSYLWSRIFLLPWQQQPPNITFRIGLAELPENAHFYPPPPPPPLLSFLRYSSSVDYYAKDGGPGEVWLLCNFYHEPLRTCINTIVNEFAISNHVALILGVHALKSYLKLICECDLHTLPNKKVSLAKDHGKNYIKVRPPLVGHLFRNRLLKISRETTYFVVLALQAMTILTFNISCNMLPFLFPLTSAQDFNE